MTQTPEMEMEVTQVAVVTRGKKKPARSLYLRNCYYVPRTFFVARLCEAAWHVAYPRLGGEIWTPRERSRYVRVHWWMDLQAMAIPTEGVHPVSFSLARTRVTLTYFVLRQGRKFSQYTVLIVAPSRVFVFSISAYVSIATTRDARPPVRWNVVR